MGSWGSENRSVATSIEFVATRLFPNPGNDSTWINVVDVMDDEDVPDPLLLESLEGKDGGGKWKGRAWL
jgi:hypothetical protein